MSTRNQDDEVGKSLTRHSGALLLPSAEGDEDRARHTAFSQAKFSFRNLFSAYTDKVFMSTPEDTGQAYNSTHKMKLQTARGPLDPLTTAVLDQPPGRAAKRLAPPGRLKRVLDFHTTVHNITTFTLSLCSRSMSHKKRVFPNVLS